MPVQVFFIFLVIACLMLSLRERVRQKRWREKNWDFTQARSSPLAQAISELVGTAGGIYLSLVLLVTFLEIEVPARVELGGVRLEPLAAFAIALAIIQPLIWRLWFTLKWNAGRR